MKPLIGITCDYYSSSSAQPDQSVQGVYHTYVDAVLRAGGLPVLIPLAVTGADLEELYGRVQGVLAPGGGDVEPVRFGERAHPRTHTIVPDRDALELDLLRRAAADGKPLFGICRGVQVLNVALGGTLWQDLPSQVPNALAHYAPADAPRDHPLHRVKIEEESHLARLTGQPILAVNSRHHQALKDVAPGLVATAFAPDGVIEAVELPGHPFALGVQWHPENFPDRPEMRALFEGFVRAARQQGRTASIRAGNSVPRA